MVQTPKLEDMPQEIWALAVNSFMGQVAESISDAGTAIEEIGERIASLEKRQQDIIAFIEPLGRLSWRLMEQIKINMSDENKKAIEALGEAASKIGFVK